MTLEVRLWTIAALCVCAFFALGYMVTHAQSLWRIDVESSALRGQVTPLAILFTTTGRALPLFVIAVIGIAISLITHTGVRVAIAIFIAQLLSQGAVELLKQVFQRVRPDAWLAYRELGYSYPSGHATTAVVFFGSWLLFALLSPLPQALKSAVVAILAVWIAGIDWSRVALGAHYPTDVLGGTLFGIACACALWAIMLHFRIVESIAG
ncbi:MAG: phosphatase PAP2 family protein [Candidatus Tumulicola sp.]